MSHENEMIQKMKYAIIDLIYEEMQWGSSFDQVERLFLIAVGQAFKELYEKEK